MCVCVCVCVCVRACVCVHVCVTGGVTAVVLPPPATSPNPPACPPPPPLQMMMGAVIKHFFAEEVHSAPDRITVVSIMPCVRKQGESERPQNMTFAANSNMHDVDHVITTAELGKILHVRALMRGWTAGERKGGDKYATSAPAWARAPLCALALGGGVLGC